MTRFAAIQYKPPKGNPSQARADLARLAGEAGGQGADIIVCPEMATAGYIWDSPEAVLPHAETARGETYEALSAVAAEFSAWVVCGYPELADGRLYNSAMVIRPDGGLQCSYKKILLYDADHTWCSPGLQREFIPTDSGGICPAICMDLNDDRLIRFLWETQPGTVAFCTNWIEENIDVLTYWRLRLLGWKGWFVAANTWGLDGDTEFSGSSMILAPGGLVAAEAPRTGDAVILAESA
jgi:predicted amidohydrolase